MENNTNNAAGGQPPAQNQQQQPIMQMRAVPNATAVLVMGIISIATCWCYGLVGLVLGIISLVLAGKGNRAYQENPNMYSESSYKNLKAGKICAIIGTSLSGAYLIFIIIYFSIVGAALGTFFTSFPWESINY